MSILDRLRKKGTPAAAPKATAVVADDAAAKKSTTPVAPVVAPTIQRVLVRPLVTEKATVTGTYCFEVALSANKSEVYKAVQKMYGVTPLSVRIMNVKGKTVRWQQTNGQRKAWKKAIVRLKAGETINVYQGT